MPEPDNTFELAADAVVAGNLPALAALLSAHPELVNARSPRPHRATLLHYVAANGVEQERQKSPPNAPEIARLPLENGAEVDALAQMYGPADTTLNLLVSSVHPYRAGVQVALIDVLADFGAALDGLHGDSSPLRTALNFGYSGAAEALAERGARVSSAAFAAGLGRMDLLHAFCEGGADREDLEQGLLWAAIHNRAEAVEYLLSHGVNPGACDRRRFTALHWAAHYGNADIVRILLAAGAPLDVQNEYGGTPLGQTIWTVHHEEPRPAHGAILEMLREAGARA